VAYQKNGHLTTEQLSALLDKQLTATGQAACDAHLQTCEQCQRMLSELRQTVALVRSLPQPDLPRSFVLPATMRSVPERPARQDTNITPITQGRRHLGVYYLQRSVRALSTIAAVLGLVFLLSGLLTVIPLSRSGGGAAGVPGASTTSNQAPNGKFNPATTPAPEKTANHDQTAGAGTATRTPTPQPTPVPTMAVSSKPSTGSSHQHNVSTGQPVLPFPDLSTTEGREGLGLILLVLGVVGYLITRHRRTRTA
jgi:hypothetical protein